MTLRIPYLWLSCIGCLVLMAFSPELGATLGLAILAALLVHRIHEAGPVNLSIGAGVVFAVVYYLYWP